MPIRYFLFLLILVFARHNFAQEDPIEELTPGVVQTKDHLLPNFFPEYKPFSTLVRSLKNSTNDQILKVDSSNAFHKSIDTYSFIFRDTLHFTMDFDQQGRWTHYTASYAKCYYTYNSDLPDTYIADQTITYSSSGNISSIISLCNTRESGYRTDYFYNAEDQLDSIILSSTLLDKTFPYQKVIFTDSLDWYPCYTIDSNHTLIRLETKNNFYYSHNTNWKIEQYAFDTLGNVSCYSLCTDNSHSIVYPFDNCSYWYEYSYKNGRIWFIGGSYYLLASMSSEIEDPIHLVKVEWNKKNAKIQKIFFYRYTESNYLKMGEWTTRKGFEASRELERYEGGYYESTSASDNVRVRLELNSNNTYRFLLYNIHTDSVYLEQFGTWSLSDRTLALSDAPEFFQGEIHLDKNWNLTFKVAPKWKALLREEKSYFNSLYWETINIEE